MDDYTIRPNVEAEPKLQIEMRHDFVKLKKTRSADYNSQCTMVFDWFFSHIANQSKLKRVP